MAKISAEQRANNKECYDNIVLDIFWECGWDGVTLDSVAKRVGVRKSTIQNYYPSKIDFGLALRGRIFPVIIESLNLSTPDEFKTSWEKAMINSPKFRQVVHLLISNSTNEYTNDMTVSGIARLKALLTETWNCEDLARDTLLWVLGLSVLMLAKN